MTRAYQCFGVAHCCHPQKMSTYGGGMSLQTVTNNLPDNTVSLNIAGNWVGVPFRMWQFPGWNWVWESVTFTERSHTLPRYVSKTGGEAKWEGGPQPHYFVFLGSIRYNQVVTVVLTFPAAGGHLAYKALCFLFLIFLLALPPLLRRPRNVFHWGPKHPLGGPASTSGTILGKYFNFVTPLLIN